MATLAVAPDAQIDAVATLAEAGALTPGFDLVALDLALPDNRGALTLPAILADFPGARLLVITGATHPQVEEQVAATGAHGFLPKSATIPDMVEAIRTVLAGGKWFTDRATGATLADVPDFARLSTLTPAQNRILHAMMDGKLNKQIAYDLGLSEITVKSHVKAILRKLGVSNRTQAILMLRNVEA